MSTGTERISGDGPAADGPEPPPPLSWRDVIRLRLAAESQSRAEPLARYAGWLGFGAGVLLCTLFLAVAPATPCTAATPCGPDRLGNVIYGLVGSLPLLALIRLEFTVAGTGALLVVTLGYEQTQTEHLPPWFYLLLVGYAVGCALLARLRRSPAPYRAGLRDWHRGARLAVPPSPARLPRPPLATTVTAALLLGTALLVAGWTGLRQSEVDEQQRRAEIVTATVRAHPSWAELDLDFPDGRPSTRLSVLDAAAYPVGSTVRVAMDDAGLRQLVTEPYDLTPWLTLVAVLALLGLGIGWRGAARVRAGRRLFRRPQPVSGVRVHQDVDRVYVYAGTGQQVLPLAEIEVRERLTRTAGDEPGPALLHGVPVPGQWCTVTIDGRTLSPTGPVLLPEPTAPWLTTRRRRAGVLVRPATSGSGRGSTPAGWAWPELTWAGRILFVALLLGAIVAGIEFSEPLLRGLVATACTVDGCSGAALVTAGWAVVGLPLLVIGVGHALLPSGSRLALGISAVALSVLAAGLAAVLPEVGYSTLRETNPELALLYPGLLAALGALVLSRAAGRWIRPRPAGPAARRSPAGPSGSGRPGGADRAGVVGWGRELRDHGLLPLVAPAALQVPALLVALLVALLGQ